jgi:outer membrane protein assembly factor BamB
VTSRVAVLVAAGSIACSAVFACHADPDEAWVHRAALPDGTHPLLALVIDRSAATANAVVADEDYDPARDWRAAVTGVAACDPTKIYFRRGPGPAPDCGRQLGVAFAPHGPAAGLHCEAARAALAETGYYVASRAAQWQAGDDGGHWDRPRDDSDGAIECRADRGRHGAAPGAWFAHDASDAPWTAMASREIAWDRAPFADAYIFYAGNFLNYLRAARTPVERSVADLLATRMARALAATDELEVALLRVDDDGPEGGYVARAPVPAAVAAADLRAIAAAPAAGDAPLAETLVEAARWLGGGARHFGTDARSDAASLDPAAPARYRSPFDHACRPAMLGMLTAGAASGDDLAAGAAADLPGFTGETGGCGLDCLAALSAWIGATDLRGDLPGSQSALVAWILSPDAGRTAQAPVATDPLAYPNLVAAAHQRDAAAVADPQLSAAALLPSVPGSTRPDAILGLTSPRARERWPGNLLRYALHAPAGPLDPPRVVDRDGEPAIDETTGLPRPGSRSLWSDAPDADLLAGGAAGRLPSPDARQVYSDIGSLRLLDPGNRLAPGNARIDRATLGLATTDPETVDDVLAWTAGTRTLGDPGLQAPVVAEYPESGLRLAFATSHDGMLHAFDADTGVEQWAWMPKELLARIPALARDGSTTARSHGIDGPLVLHRHDANRDGRIDPASGDHLWLLFGLGRGGPRYYSVDIGRPADPQLLWSAALPDPPVDSLAAPVVTRLAIEGAGQSGGDWVVLLAGGYDRRFDAMHATGSGRGRALLVLDAGDGQLLWSAAARDGDLALEGLASLATAPRLLDLDGDGYLDRAYLVDVAGALWRIDFESGRSAGDLASATRIARLGSGAQRFQATPDVSIARFGASSRIAVAVGSGWFTRPRDTSHVDRVYVVFDDEAAGERAEDDLFDATEARDAMPPDAPGWFVRLEAGQKVVGSTVTFDHVLRFQTYEPLPPDATEPCGPPRGASRLHALDVRTALPRTTAAESEEDTVEDIAASGLPPGLRIGFPGRWEGACEGCKPRPFGIIGGETFDPGYGGDPVRTSWRKRAPPPDSR